MGVIIGEFFRLTIGRGWLLYRSHNLYCWTRFSAQVGDSGSADFFVPCMGKSLIMNADFLAVLDFWEREKGISREVLVQAVEEALLSAAKKAVGPARELRCAIDTKNGDIKAFAKLVVSEKVLSK